MRSPDGRIDALGQVYLNALRSTGGNDASQIQAALNASSGGTLTVPPSLFVVETTLTVPPNTTLYAYGATFDYSRAGNITGLSLGSGSIVWGLELVGAGGSVYDDNGRAIQASGTYNSPAAPTYIRGPQVYDCKIREWSGYGAYLDLCIGADFFHNIFDTIGYAAVSGNSCSNCHADYNEINKVDGAGSSDWYGIVWSRHEAATLVTHPRSASCTMNFNTITNSPNAHGVDTHGGVDIKAYGNDMSDVRWGVVFTGSKDGGAFAKWAPQRCKSLGNTIRLSGNGGMGVIINGAYKGAGDTQADFWELADGCSAMNDTIENAGDPGNLEAGAIQIYGTTNAVIASQTIIRPWVNGVVVDFANTGFTIGPNIIIDPHDATIDPSYVKIHGSNNSGHIVGHTHKFTDPTLDVKVGKYSVYVTPGRTGVEVTYEAYKHEGADATHLLIATDNDASGNGVRIPPQTRVNPFGSPESGIADSYGALCGDSLYGHLYHKSTASGTAGWRDIWSSFKLTTSTPDATPVPLIIYAVPANGDITLDILITAERSTDRALMQRRAFFKRLGGVTTQVGATQTLGADEIDAGLAGIASTIDNVGDNIRAVLTGLGIGSVDWVVKTTLSENY